MNDILLDCRYKELIRPSNLFTGLCDVMEFCKDSNREDLIWFLRACENDECFEYCRYIKNLIDEKE